jgi:hypothetical protein
VSVNKSVSGRKYCTAEEDSVEELTTKRHNAVLSMLYLNDDDEDQEEHYVKNTGPPNVSRAFCMVLVFD